MSMVNPYDPPQVQIEKQARIIDALVRRANRQSEIGPSAYRAFQSAIDLQQQVAAQTLELETVRSERERTRKTLVEALSSMGEGVALFSDERLNICNDLFRGLLPDISHKIIPGLSLSHYLELVEISARVVSTDRKLSVLRQTLKVRQSAGATTALVVELVDDRWYQLSIQQTSVENTVVLMTEITALVRRNRMEKEHLIDRQADYLAAVFQNMGSGVCSFSAEGEVIMQNGRFREILGVPLTLLQPGTPLSTLLDFLRTRSLISEDAWLRVDEWRDELRRKGALVRRVNHGSDRVLDVHANVLPDGGFLVELKDVTLETQTTELLENRVMARTAELTRANEQLTAQYEEKARVEEELRLSKERAEAAVSSKTRFLAAASHDLLQPINAAKLLISTLQEATRETGFQPMVKRLKGAFSSAENLLHSLLDISRLESADPDAVSVMAVDLGALMESVRDDQSPLAARKGVRLTVVPCLLFVRSDPVYLMRSIQNLVVNAVQYTEPGGRVLVGARRRGDHVVVEVWDTGVGIAEKDQARIFEEFTRGDDVQLGSGVGLGLSIVDRACRLLGHELSVRSKPGWGSVFRMNIALADGVPIRREAQSALADESGHPIDHIVMVIENDEDVLYGTIQWLEQWGASVLAARSTEEALAHVNDMGIPPDIILADYQLDGPDTGIMAITAIREITGSDVPAIMITADRSELVRRLGLENDLTVMTKPAALSRLRPLIDWKIRRHAAAAAHQRAQVETQLQTKVGGDRA
ncbi:PAS-domain containing protein [Dinoroseobacter sp. S375]|uniref:hybrid sensor histidine kinase/response regulator n=1 Tax=Dinoroseobacter sp. S375 TaxID=3415136 RepID=UPI003C7C90E1